MASGGDGNALRASVPRFSMTDPVEEDPIKIGIVGGTGTISCAIVSRLLALQSQAGATCYDIVCINRGVADTSPYPSGVRHLLLDRHDRDAFEQYVCAVHPLPRKTDLHSSKRPIWNLNFDSICHMNHLSPWSV